MEEDAIVRAMRLALLERKEEEQQALHADIENILSFVMSVQSVDTALSEDAPGKKNVFRDDAVTVPAGLYREQMLRQAPNRFKDWFLSKKNVVVMKYTDATVQDLQRALADGTTTATALVSEARNVVRERDADIRAFVEVFDSAEEDAKRADEMLRAGDTHPLTGIPIAVKDNMCIAEHTVTAGSKILTGFVSPYDATVIAKLRAQGAVLFGRTNMDEFAMGSSTEYSVYGTTNNPHDRTRVSGGSSGGSAAAVAMGAVPLALGSDTGGSIRQPASFCGIVGLKPTYGSVSRHGLIALGSSLDVVGPLARTVDDAALLFNTMRGEDERYDTTEGIFAGVPTPSGDMVIGVPDNLASIGVSAETLQVFEKTVASLTKKGYTTKQISLPLFECAPAVYYIIQPAEASSNLARFDGMRYGFYRDGNDVRDTYIQTRSVGFGDEVTRRIIVGTHVLSAGYYDAYYRKATEVRDAMRTAFLTLLGEVRIILLPTTPDVAFKEGAIQDPVLMYAEDRLTLQANLTGLPAISVPMHTDGLPRGIQCMGGYNDEEALFTCARDILGE